MMGDFLFDGIEEVWKDLRGEKNDQELRDEIQTLVQTNTRDLRESVTELVEEIAADQKSEWQEALNVFLFQVQAMIRRSLRSPADPTGTTLQAHLVPKTARGLAPYLPTRISPFKPGDIPLSSADLQLEELLGFGGFGEVWRACNPDYPGFAPVALKFCLDPTAADMLKNEAAVLDRVSRQGTHPGIVRLQHTYLRAPIPFLEYEYVEGGDLTGLIKKWHSEPGGV